MLKRYLPSDMIIKNMNGKRLGVCCCMVLKKHVMCPYAYHRYSWRPVYKARRQLQRQTFFCYLNHTSLLTKGKCWRGSCRKILNLMTKISLSFCPVTSAIGNLGPKISKVSLQSLRTKKSFKSQGTLPTAGPQCLES